MTKTLFFAEAPIYQLQKIAIPTKSPSRKHTTIYEHLLFEVNPPNQEEKKENRSPSSKSGVGDLITNS